MIFTDAFFISVIPMLVLLGFQRYFAASSGSRRLPGAAWQNLRRYA
jgi:hypothetical protein